MKQTSKPRKRHHGRKHDHFRVLVTYTDNEQSVRVYADKTRAEKYAERIGSSPVVKSVTVTKLD
jgi:hypothetical protein